MFPEKPWSLTWEQARRLFPHLPAKRHANPAKKAARKRQQEARRRNRR